MIGVVPTPVLSATVIIVKNPLKTFEVLKEHLPLEVNAVRSGNILLQLSLIIESLSLDRIHGEFMDKTCHEFQVLLTVLVNDLFLRLNLRILCDIL